MRLNRGYFFSALAGVIVGAVLMTVLPAAADDGDYLVLGETNTATSPTKVWARRGVLFRAAKMDTPAATFLVRSGPPIAVESTAKVENLNTDLLDGYEADDFLRDIQVVSMTIDGALDPGESQELTATCPLGYVVTGGGAEAPPWFRIYGSYPDAATANAWIAEITNPNAAAGTGVMRSYAICSHLDWQD